MAGYEQAAVLFEVAGTPIVRITIWSHKLQMWCYLVPERTGQNPPGTLEITPVEIEALKAWVAAGWELREAIRRITGQ